jgi:prepilin-type N-terminal cleavage/methylation domain-containing protein
MRQKGFTVVELIIVLAIVGIIASIFLRTYYFSTDIVDFYDRLKVLIWIFVGIAALFLGTYVLYGEAGIKKLHSYHRKLSLLFFVLIIVYAVFIENA